MNDPVALPGVRGVIAGWPWPYRVAWAGVAIVTMAYLVATGCYWSDLDPWTVRNLISSGNIVGLLTNPFASDTWDRVIVLGGCIWCWLQLRPKLHSLPSSPTPWLGLPLMSLGVALVPVVWFCYGQIGARPVMIWLFYLTAALSLIGLILTQFGLKHVLALKFVFAFAWIALPIPGRINHPLQQLLQGMTTILAHEGLALVGIDVVRQGFVLKLPHGDLGVVEACSGIRSLTSLLAIAAFVAFINNFRPLRGISLLVLSIPVIVFVNGLRVLLTGILQEYASRNWAMGWRHEVVGYAMVFLGLGLILLLAHLMNPNKKTDDEIVTAPGRIPSTIAGWIAAIMVVTTVAMGIFAFSRPSVARNAVVDGNPPLEAIPMTIGQWTGSELPIDPDITAMMQYDKAIARRYRNRLGHEVDIWVIYWQSAKAVKGYHHPDICMTNRGSVIAAREERTMTTPSGLAIPVSYREFTGEKLPRSYVNYWTQEGRYFWTPADEKAAFAMTFPFEWIRRRMGERPADAADDRIVVLMGSLSKEKLAEVSGRVSDALYEVCPWGRPK
jgi:exosortase